MEELTLCGVISIFLRLFVLFVPLESNIFDYKLKKLQIDSGARVLSICFANGFVGSRRPVRRLKVVNLVGFCYFVYIIYSSPGGVEGGCGVPKTPPGEEQDYIIKATKI